MGNSDADTPAKPAKTSAAQEQPPSGTASSATVYPDWSGFPAYSPIPPHGFFPSPVASSPQTHSYIWGAQHMMPPYGTPPPYVMYPHGGLYAHPSLPPGTHPFSPYAVPTPNGNLETSGATPGGLEMDGKSAKVKEKSPMKRSKGSLGSLNMITGKNNNEHGKSGTPANGVLSHSGEGESGSEDSSEGSDANSQNDSQTKNDGQGTFEADQTLNGVSAHSSRNGVACPPSQAVVPIMPLQATGAPNSVVSPTTNLNIGMDYWSAPNPSAMVPIRGKVSGATGVGGLRENIPADPWLQDERELKRQRRKQSNRESARRSRLRKQAECEELAQRVDALKEENDALKAELNRVKKEYQQLVSDNSSLKEKYEIHRGTDEARVERSDQICGDGKCHKQTDSDMPEGQDDAMKSR